MELLSEKAEMVLMAALLFFKVEVDSLSRFAIAFSIMCFSSLAILVVGS